MHRIRTLHDARVQNAAVVCISLTLFYLTMPSRITLEDAGLFQMICHLGGISHPPGYPLFTQLCNWMVGPPTVTAGNMVSAVFAALAVGVFYQVVRILTHSNVTGFIAALAYAFSATFWSQAIIIEVYSLAVLMFMICWWLLLKFLDSRQPKYWFGLCVAAGLALSNHWPLFLLSCAGFVPLLFGIRRSVPDFFRSTAFWAGSLLLIALGLTPYITLWMESDPQIAVFGAIGPDEFFNYIARAYYVDARIEADLQDKLQYFAWLIPETLLQLGIAAIPITILGIYRSFRQLEPYHSLSLLLIYLATTFLLMYFFNFPFETFFQGVFRPYPVIAFSALAVWFAIGLVWITGKIPEPRASLRIPLALIFLVSILAFNFPKVDRSDASLVDRYARLILASLPENAILFLSGDNQAGPLGFLNRVEGFRSDVTLYEKESLVFSNRLTGVWEPTSRKRQAARTFIKNAERPVFSIYESKDATTNYGLYYGYNSFNENRFVFVPEFELFLDQLLEIYEKGLLTDLHEKRFVYDLIISFARQQANYLQQFGTLGLTARQQERINRVLKTFPGKLARLEAIVKSGIPVEAGPLVALVEAADRQLDHQASTKHLAVFYTMYGLIMQATNQEKKAIEMFGKSLELMPHPKNESICELKKIYEKNADHLNLTELQRRFSTNNC